MTLKRVGHLLEYNLRNRIDFTIWKCLQKNRFFFFSWYLSLSFLNRTSINEKLSYWMTTNGQDLDNLTSGNWRDGRVTRPQNIDTITLLWLAGMLQRWFTLVAPKLPGILVHILPVSGMKPRRHSDGCIPLFLQIVPAYNGPFCAKTQWKWSITDCAVDSISDLGYLLCHEV